MEWSTFWSTMTKSHFTHLFFPSPLKSFQIYNFIRKPALVTQILTGHCLLNAHQKRLGLRDCDLCPCCEVVEDPIHFLFECPRYELLRLELYNRIFHPNAPTKDNFATFSDRESVQALNDFLIKSKRFSRSHRPSSLMPNQPQS